MTTDELFQELRKKSQESLENIRTKLLPLSEQQRLWRPSENAWNITEIFAHLNLFANYYHKTFISHIEKTRFTLVNSNFVSSPLGRSAWKSMKLGNANNIKRKFKAQRIYNPKLDPKLIAGQDLEKFESNLEELQNILKKAEVVNVRKVKIPISISKIVRLKLGDALLFVSYHNERHVQQALNLIAHPKFPK